MKTYTKDEVIEFMVFAQHFLVGLVGEDKYTIADAKKDFPKQWELYKTRITKLFDKINP